MIRGKYEANLTIDIHREPISNDLSVDKIKQMLQDYFADELERIIQDECFFPGEADITIDVQQADAWEE